MCSSENVSYQDCINNWQHSKPVTSPHKSWCIQEGEAEVADHLKAVGCPPLQLALPWIMTAFAGHLAVGEVLLLWDRIIGFDSLLPLPLLAVAVIAFRRQVRGQTLRLATRSLQAVKMYTRQQLLVASC